jgi:hypothetical protein
MCTVDGLRAELGRITVPADGQDQVQGLVPQRIQEPLEQARRFVHRGAGGGVHVWPRGQIGQPVRAVFVAGLIEHHAPTAQRGRRQVRRPDRRRGTAVPRKRHIDHALSIQRIVEGPTHALVRQRGNAGVQANEVVCVAAAAWQQNLVRRIDLQAASIPAGDSRSSNPDCSTPTRSMRLADPGCTSSSTWSR